MKKSIVTIIAVVLIGGTAMAQGDQKRPQRPKMDRKEMAQKRTDMMVKQYGLNSKQAKKLKELNQNYAEKMGPRGMGPRPAGGPRPHGHRGDMKPQGKLEGQAPQAQPDLKRPEGKRAEPTPEMKKRFAQREENRKAYDAELQKIMTADQFKKYQADEANRRPPMRPHRGGGGHKEK